MNGDAAGGARTKVPSEQSALRREVGLWQLVAYGVGNIIGAGIYVLVGEASGTAGGMVWLAFVIGAGIAALTGLSYAELGAMYPRAASEYVFLGRAYGSRILAFLTEWTMLLTEVVAGSAVAIGFAGYLHGMTGAPGLPTALLLILALGALTLLGIRGSLFLNTVLSLVAIAGLVFVSLLGLLKPTPGVVPGHGTAPFGFEGVLAAAALVFFAYIGFDNITNLAEETKDPQRTIPRGLMLSVALSTILYVLVGLAVTALAPWQELSRSEAPLALAASKALGTPAFHILAIAALLTTANTCLVLMTVSSRIVYGMAREGALPAAAGRVSRTGAPYLAVIVVVFAMAGFLAMGSTGAIARVTSFGSMFTFALVNLAMLHLRRVAPNLARPFKAPLSLGWLSISGLLGLISCLVMMTRFDGKSVLLGLLLPVSGVVVYALYRPPHAPEAAEPLHEPHEESGPGGTI